MSNFVDISNRYLDEWQGKKSTPNFKPDYLLKKICDLIEDQTEVFYKSDPDPFDERHPIRINPEGAFGLVLKAILKDDNFMNTLVGDYMNSRNYSPNSDNELLTTSCQLFLDILPGMETSFVLSESEGLLSNLYNWAENGKDPLSSFAIGIIGVAMEIPELAGESKDKNAHLVPIMLKRLKKLCQESQVESQNEERAFLEIFNETPEDNVVKNKRKDKNLAKTSKKLKREDIAIDNNSNSNWAEMQPHIIGSYRLVPLTSQMKQRLILKYLTALGGYQEHVSAVFEHDALNLLFHYIDMAIPPATSEDACLTFKALHYLASLFVHKKFALAFINAGGLQKLLEIRRPSMAATGVSLCLYYLAYYEEAMERICQLPYPVLAKMIEYVLWLLECSHQSSRTHAVLFFSVSFSFRIILDIFDFQDGLRKIYNNVNTLEIFSDENNTETYLSEDDLFVKRQFCRYCITALKRYFEAQLLLIPVKGLTFVDYRTFNYNSRQNLMTSAPSVGCLSPNSNNNNIESNGYQSDAAISSLTSEIGSGERYSYAHYLPHHYMKPLKMTNETLLLAIKAIGEMYPNLNEWSCMKEFYNLGGIYLLLKVVLIVGDWIFNSRNEIVRNILEILRYATFNQPYIQLNLCRHQTFPSSIAFLDDQNSISGLCIVFMCAESNIVNDPEVQKSALGIIINCLYTKGPSLSTIPASANLASFESYINTSSLIGVSLTPKNKISSVHSQMLNKISLLELPINNQKLQTSHKKRSIKSVDEIFHKIWKTIRNNNGLMVLLNLLTTRTPINDADEIRFLACKALCGLLRSDNVLQIMSKLPLFNNGQFQQLMREPISQDNLANHLQFCQYAAQLLQTIKGQKVVAPPGSSNSIGSCTSSLLLPSAISSTGGQYGSFLSSSLSNVVGDETLSFDQLYRANIVAQTKITFSQKELLLLIYNYLNEHGFKNASSSLFNEARDILLSSNKETYNQSIYSYGGNAPTYLPPLTSLTTYNAPSPPTKHFTNWPILIPNSASKLTPSNSKKLKHLQRLKIASSSSPLVVSRSFTDDYQAINTIGCLSYKNPRVDVKKNNMRSLNQVIKNLPSRFGALKNVPSSTNFYNEEADTFKVGPKLEENIKNSEDLGENEMGIFERKQKLNNSPTEKGLMNSKLTGNKTSPSTNLTHCKKKKKKLVIQSTIPNDSYHELNGITDPILQSDDTPHKLQNEKLKLKLMKTLSDTPDKLENQSINHGNDILNTSTLEEDDNKISNWQRTNNLFYQQSPALRKLNNIQKLKNVPAKLENIITDYLREQHSRCRNPMAICPPFSVLLPHQCPVPKNRKCASFNITRRQTHIPVFPLYGGLDGKLMNKKFVYGRMKGIKVIRDPEEDIFMTCCSFQKNNLTTLYIGTENGEIKCFNIDTGIEDITYTLSGPSNNSSDHEDDIDLGPINNIQIWPDYYNINRVPFHATSVFGEVDYTNQLYEQQPKKPYSPGDQIVLTYHSNHWRNTSYLWLLNDKAMVQSKQTFKNLEYPSFNNLGHLPYRVIGSENEKAYLYDVETGLKLSAFHVPSLCNNYLKNRALFNSTDDQILSDGILWDVDTSQCIHKFDKLNPNISGQFHPNGYQVIINSEIWDLRTYKLLNTVPAFDQCRLTFNPTNEIIYGMRYFDVDEDRLNPNDIQTDRFLTSIKVFDSNTDYHGSSSNNRHLANVDLRKIIYDMTTESSDRYLAIIEGDSIFRSPNAGNNSGGGTAGNINTNISSNSSHHLHNANPNNVFTTLLNEDMEDRRICRIYEIGKSKDSCSRDVEEEETEAEHEIDDSEVSSEDDEDDYGEFSVTDISYHSGSDTSSSYTTISSDEDGTDIQDIDLVLDTEMINNQAAATAGNQNNQQMSSLSPTSTARRRRVRRRPRSNMTTTTSASSTLYNLAEPVPSNPSAGIRVTSTNVSTIANNLLNAQSLTTTFAAITNQNTIPPSISTNETVANIEPISTTPSQQTDSITNEHNRRTTRSSTNNNSTSTTNNNPQSSTTRSSPDAGGRRRRHRGNSSTITTTEFRNNIPLTTRSLNRIINAAITLTPMGRSNRSNEATVTTTSTTNSNPLSTGRSRTRNSGNSNTIIIATTADILPARSSRNESRNNSNAVNSSSRRRSNRVTGTSSRNRHYSNRRIRRRSESVYDNEYEVIEEEDEPNAD